MTDVGAKRKTAFDWDLDSDCDLCMKPSRPSKRVHFEKNIPEVIDLVEESSPTLEFLLEKVCADRALGERDFSLLKRVLVQHIGRVELPSLPLIEHLSCDNDCRCKPNRPIFQLRGCKINKDKLRSLVLHLIFGLIGLRSRPGCSDPVSVGRNHCRFYLPIPDITQSPEDDKTKMCFWLDRVRDYIVPGSEQCLFPSTSNENVVQMLGVQGFEGCGKPFEHGEVYDFLLMAAQDHCPSPGVQFYREPMSIEMARSKIIEVLTLEWNRGRSLLPGISTKFLLQCYFTLCLYDFRDEIQNDALDFDKRYKKFLRWYKYERQILIDEMENNTCIICNDEKEPCTFGCQTPQCKCIVHSRCLDEWRSFNQLNIYDAVTCFNCKSESITPLSKEQVRNLRRISLHNCPSCEKKVPVLSIIPGNSCKHCNIVYPPESSLLSCGHFSNKGDVEHMVKCKKGIAEVFEFLLLEINTQLKKSRLDKLNTLCDKLINV